MLMQKVCSFVVNSIGIVVISTFMGNYK